MGFVKRLSRRSPSASACQVCVTLDRLSVGYFGGAASNLIYFPFPLQWRYIKRRKPNMCPYVLIKILCCRMLPQCSKHNAEYHCHCNHAHTDECKDVFWPVADPPFVGVVFYGWGNPIIDSVEGAWVRRWIAARVFMLCV